MTDKMLRIKDAEYFNSAMVEFTDHPTEDVRTYLESSLEPAPPKDWKPTCFDEHSCADSEHCDGEHETNWMGYIQKEFRDRCEQCPYRKME